MTMSEEKRASLKYRLLGMGDDVGSWGHEYVRHLAGDVTYYTHSSPLNLPHLIPAFSARPALPRA